MAKSITALKSSKSNDPPIVFIYGNGGMGKTSLASEFPNPIYLPMPGEKTPSNVDMPTPGVIESYDELVAILGELGTQQHDRQTVIIDSLDGLEPLVWRKTCERMGYTSIEAPGYGKGFAEADTEWLFLIDCFIALQKDGICVVLIAHPEIKRFDSPTSDPYSRYSPKLQKRANDLFYEKSDIVAFVSQRVTLKEKEVARQTKVTHGESGGDRQIHLEERPGYRAKNRFEMPATLPFKKGQGYAEMSKYFPAPYFGKVAA